MEKRNTTLKSQEPIAKSQWQTFTRLVTYLWPTNRSDLKARVIFALLALLIAKGVNVYVPFLFKGSIDQLSINPVIALPLGLIIAYGLARILQQGFGELRDFVFAKVSQHAQRQVALETFQHLHRQSMRFHLDRQTGGLTRVIERGTKGVQFVLTFMLFNILPTILEIILVTSVLHFHFKSVFSITTLLTILGYIAFTLGITEWRTQHRKAMNQTDAEANTKAIDSLLNYETVKYFCNEDHELSRYDVALKGYEKASIQSQTGLSLLNFGQGVIIGIGLIVVMWIAAEGVVAGKFTVGDFVLVNTYLIQLYLPLNFLGFVYREVKQGLIDMEKMFELLAMSPEIIDSASAPNLNIRAGKISFNHVSFAYNPDRAILKSISFEVPAGKTVAIVGESGSGKSTIARLLFRFYDATSGSIEIDGQNINSVNQNSLRRAIGIVPQDTVLFNDTIEYNIRYGRPDAATHDVIQAAQLAEIDTFVESLPQKYQTTVGERGLKLSGGEKQRVAIARTILKNPKILVFDEATSALDSKTEREIQASLHQVASNRTTLIIAHRLSTIVHAHQILVMKAGSIIERGTHEELLAKKSEYAAMWNQQAKLMAQHAEPV